IRDFHVTGVQTCALPISPFAELDLPDGLDAIVTVQNYHDLHLKHFPADTARTVNAELFKSLKPGGVLLVVDHEALPGSGHDAARSEERRVGKEGSSRGAR